MHCDVDGARRSSDGYACQYKEVGNCKAECMSTTGILSCRGVKERVYWVARRVVPSLQSAVHVGKGSRDPAERCGAARAGASVPAAPAPAHPPANAATAPALLPDVYPQAHTTPVPAFPEVAEDPGCAACLRCSHGVLIAAVAQK